MSTTLQVETAEDELEELLTKMRPAGRQEVLEYRSSVALNILLSLLKNDIHWPIAIRQANEIATVFAVNVVKFNQKYINYGY